MQPSRRRGAVKMAKQLKNTPAIAGAKKIARNFLVVEEKTEDSPAVTR